MRSNGGNSVSSLVDGLSDGNEITELFADKYEDLYSCVSYDEGEMMALKSYDTSTTFRHSSNKCSM